MRTAPIVTACRRSWATMLVGYADPEELDEASRRALEIAAETLVHDFAGDACRLRRGDVLDPGTAMAERLPAKHRLRYTREFAFDFLGALYVVLHRLAARRNEAPICTNTAQELAFRGLIEAAVGFLDGADDTPLWDFHEMRVEDLDIEVLFDARLDGLEDPATHPDTTPPVNLEFDQWFEPFGGAWPPVGGSS